MAPGRRRGSWRLARSLLLVAQLIAGSLAQTGDATPQDPSYTCSADAPCAVGCCGQYGICGMGPDFCAPENCINSCDAKAECNPAGWPAQYVNAETCPLNVCCSQYGFCGTTAEFCGANPIAANPSCPGGKSASQRRVGYYEGWSVGRPCDAMFPEQIPVGAYTHLNFAFASIDPDSFAVAPADPGDVALYGRLTALKASHPGLQVWISIGGWTMNDPDQPTATTFSDLAGSVANQQKFFASLLSFMATYGFDGVDIDWEYPVAPERSGKPEDYANYPSFLGNLRSAFQAAGENYGVTITAPSSFWYLQNFDIVSLEPLVDWFNMMEYDLHGTWDSTDVWIGPYVNAHTNLTEIDESLKLLWRNNISPSKVVLGLGFYGRSFALEDPSCTAPGCPFTGGAPPGRCTQSAGTLSYAEIEDAIAAGGTVTLDSAAAVKIVTYGGNWVSYDDATTLQTKVDWANNNCLGGVMVWAVSLDDGNATAATALAAATGQVGVNLFVATTDLTDVCVWTPCGGPPTCPAGTSAAFTVYDGCPPVQGTVAADQVPRRAYCCPINQMPICGIGGALHPGDPAVVGDFCVQEACAAGTTLVTTTTSLLFGMSCPSGQLNMCCTVTPAVAMARDGCSWTGNVPGCAAPNTDAACPAGTYQLTASLHGDGGSQPCTSGFQSLCCNSESTIVPATCGWYQNGANGFCSPGCPAGKIQLATDTAAPGCVVGWGSFCCDAPLGSLGSDPAGVAQFSAQVSAYLQGGAVCAASHDAIDDQAGPPGAVGKKKRQSTVSTVDSWVISGLLVSLILQQRSGYPVSPLYGQAWDGQAAATSTSYSQLLAIMQPPFGGYADPVEFMNDLLCTGADAQATIQDIQSSSSTLCTDSVPVIAARGEHAEGYGLAARNPWAHAAENGTDVEKRRIFWDSLGTTTGRAGRPVVGQVLNALTQGQLRLEYFRWFGLQDGMAELEVVYLLGTDTNNMRTDLMQNSNLADANANRFLMVHIHFAQGNVNGHLVPNAFNLRHASNIQRAPGLMQAPGAFWCPSTQDTNALVWTCPVYNPAPNARTVVAVNLDGPAPATTGGRFIYNMLQQIRAIGFPAGQNGDLLATAGHQSMWRYATAALTPNTYTLIRPQPFTQGGWVPGTEPLLNPDSALWNNNGLNGLAFDANGNLYNPITAHNGDLIQTTGFFIP